MRFKLAAAICLLVWFLLPVLFPEMLSYRDGFLIGLLGAAVTILAGELID